MGWLGGFLPENSSVRISKSHGVQRFAIFLWYFCIMSFTKDGCAKCQSVWFWTKKSFWRPSAISAVVAPQLWSMPPAGDEDVDRFHTHPSGAHSMLSQWIHIFEILESKLWTFFWFLGKQQKIVSGFRFSWESKLEKISWAVCRRLMWLDTLQFLWQHVVGGNVQCCRLRSRGENAEKTFRNKGRRCDG